jgi:predicted nuclease with TOPRIM domain
MTDREKVTHMRDHKERIDKERLQSLPLKGGDGGGTSDSMEERVSQLEKKFDRLETKLDTNTTAINDMRVSMATITERVAHLPSKEFIYKGIAGLIAVMGTLAVLAPKLQQMFGIIPK